MGRKAYQSLTSRSEAKNACIYNASTPTEFMACTRTYRTCIR
jgi:hypothetical protein